MPSITDLAGPLQAVLTATAERLARQHGAVRRCRKFSGATLVQTLVFGWLAHPAATLTQLVQMAALRGVVISPQGLEQRFTAALAECLQQLVAATVQAAAVAGEPVAVPLLARFTGVYVLDSTTIGLPAEVAAQWPGCGGRPGQGQAAVTLQVRLDLRTGRLDGPLLQPGRAQDRATPLQHAPLPTGSLRLADLGYFVLGVFRALGEAGSHWLSRLRADVAVFTAEGARVAAVGTWLTEQADPHGHVETWVTLGARERLPARLVAWRVPQVVADGRRRRLRQEARKKGQAVSRARLALADWTILVTNVPADLLSREELRVLARARWQIELVFKLWKQHGRLAVSRSQRPWRLVSEVYAKLVALIIQHWLLVASGWAAPDKSMVKAAQAVRDQAALIAAALDELPALTAALRRLARGLRAGCRLNRRRRHPNTYQLLLDPSLGGLS